MSFRCSFTTVSKRSWHYRMVTAFHGFWGEKYQTNTTWGYWLISVPEAFVCLSISAAIGLVITVCTSWALVAIAVWAFSNPLDFILQFGVIIIGSALTILIAWALTLARDQIKQNAPVMKVKE
jgi:hypothetical protein